jgi:hypothetical protein
MRLKAFVALMVMVLGFALSARADTIDSGGTFFTEGSVLTMVNFQPTIELTEDQPVYVEPNPLADTTFATYSCIYTMVNFQPTFELIPYLPVDNFILYYGTITQTSTNLTVTPVPASVLLFGPGLLGLALRRRNHL